MELFSRVGVSKIKIFFLITSELDVLYLKKLENYTLKMPNDIKKIFLQ